MLLYVFLLECFSKGVAEHVEANRRLTTSWTEVTGTAGWSTRRYHSSVVYNNNIYVIGGSDGARLDDVWSSDDPSRSS
jgi:hypothetical protein